MFSEVVDAPADQQDALLDRLCPEDDLRTQVRAMLNADASDDPLLDHSLIPTPFDVLVGEFVQQHRLLRRRRIAVPGRDEALSVGRIANA